MKLTTKVLLYTALTTLTVGLLIIGYFMFMLPGLYVEHKLNQNVNIVATTLEQTRENNGCDIALQNHDVMNATFRLAKTSGNYELLVCTNYSSSTIVVQDDSLQSIMDQLRLIPTAIKNGEPVTEIDFSGFDLSKYSANFNNDALFTVVDHAFRDFGTSFQVDSERIYQKGDSVQVMSSQVSNDSVNYTNYIGFTENSENILVTVATTLTPKLNELKPILLQSMPMILVVLVFFAMFTAALFTKLLASPIDTLAKQALHNARGETVRFKQKNQHDEYKVLEDALNSMQDAIQQSVDELRSANELLSLQSERQKVFLMNASHQLKTPLSGALLLTDGMIHQIGTYKDVQKHLPSVQQELVTMKHMIDNMLSAFETELENKPYTEETVVAVVQNILADYTNLINKKNLKISVSGDYTIRTELSTFHSILDHLIQNAIQYSPDNANISIYISSLDIKIINTDVTIEQNILEHIFDPFIRDHRSGYKGSGLGLYIVDQMVKSLDMTITIQNNENSVLTHLDWRHH